MSKNNMALAHMSDEQKEYLNEAIKEAKKEVLEDFILELADHIRRASFIANYRSSQVYMNGNDYFLSTRDLDKADPRNLYIMLKEGDLEIILEELKLKIDKGE